MTSSEPDAVALAAPRRAPPARAAKRPPKIVHVCTSDMSVGVLLLHQLLRYRDAGYEVVAVSTPGPHLRAAERAGIRVLTVPMVRAITPLRDLGALYRLWRLFRRERPALVHTHSPKAGLLGQYAALLAGVPARVHTIHGLYFPGHMTPRTRPLFVALEKATMRFAHLALSQNPEDVSTALAAGICRPGRIRLLGNGIDLSRFDRAALDAAAVRAVRAAAGAAPGQPLVGIVARVNREKGYEEFFAAARRVAAAHPGVRFAVVGPVEKEKGNHLDPVALARAHGLEERVRYLGSRDDMPAVYAAFDLLVLPSHREGWPRAPMEAAALGVPCVATDIRGCRQVVVHGVTGLLVPVRDAERLADAMDLLLGEPARRRAMGDAARRHALAWFDERSVVRLTLEAYADLGVRPATAP